MTADRNIWPAMSFGYHMGRVEKGTLKNVWLGGRVGRGRSHVASVNSSYFERQDPYQ